MAKNKEKKPSGFAAMFRTKAMRAGGYSIAAAAVIIAIAILINVLAGHISTAYTQFDTTSSGLYSIADQTRQTVKGLEADVDIYYIVSEGNELSYISRLLDKFEALGKKLKVTKIDPDVDPDFTKAYSDEAVPEGSLIVVSGDRNKIVTMDDMITYEAGSAQYYQYYAQQGQQTDVYWNGEVQLVKAIDYVTNDAVYNVYVMGGSYSDISAYLDNENITASELDIEAGDFAVPEDADALMLSDIGGDISDDVYSAIDSYLKNGGKLFVAADYSADGYKNLEKLLASWGISYTDGNVNDKQSGYYNSYNGTSQDLLPRYTGEHAVIYPLLEDKSNIPYFTGTMGILYKETEGVTFTPLAQTSSSAYLDYDEDADEEPEFMTHTVAAAAENTATGAELVVFGDSDFMTASVTEMAPSNIDLFINSIGWLCDKDSAIAVHAKTITSSTELDFSKSSSVPLIMVIAVLPTLAAIAAGAVIWYRRKNK